MRYANLLNMFLLFQNGLNALHLASKEGHVEVVAELLKLEAAVDAATKVGPTSADVMEEYMWIQQCKTWLHWRTGQHAATV